MVAADSAPPSGILAVAASAFFNVLVAEVTPEMCERAKTLTFSVRCGELLTAATPAPLDS